MKHIPSERIMAYYDGELSAAEALEVESHLEACPACREELTLYYREGMMIATLPVSKKNRTAIHAIWHRAEADTVTALPRLYHRIHAAFRPLLATAAAALVIVLTLFFLAGPGQEGRDGLDAADNCPVEQETDAIVRGYDNLPSLYN